MADKGLKIFDECAATCMHLCPQKEECISSSWGQSKTYTPSTVTNLQRIPTKIIENGAIVKVIIFLEQVIL